MFRSLLATLTALAIMVSVSGAANAAGIQLSLDTSTCGKLTISATGLTPNTAYQLVADGGYPDVVKAVTASASGTASATISRSEASSDSSADWGNASVRTQYGGYLEANVIESRTTNESGAVVVTRTPTTPAYHFTRCP